MGSASEFIDKNMNFNELKNLRLQWMRNGEGDPEFPWQVVGPTGIPYEDAVGLVFHGGLLWFDKPRQTIRFTADEYAEGGLGTDPPTWYVTRHYVEFFTSVTTATVVHNLNTVWPVVQIVQTIPTPSLHFRVYDIFGAGGFIQHNDSDTVSLDFGGTFTGQVVVIG